MGTNKTDDKVKQSETDWRLPISSEKVDFKRQNLTFLSSLCWLCAIFK